MLNLKNNKWFKNILYVFSYAFLISATVSCLLSDDEIVNFNLDEGLVFCEGEAEEGIHDPLTHEVLFEDGDGSSGFPFEICTVQQLQKMADNLTAHYILIGNVDASATAFEESDFGVEGFIPIGDCLGYCDGVSDSPFVGSFNGNGFTIAGLFINSDKRSIGLFTVLDSGAVVTDVKFSEAAILARPSGLTTNGYTYYTSVGTLAGSVVNTYYGESDYSPQIDKIHVDYACVGSYSRCYDYFYSDGYPYATVSANAGGIIGYASQVTNTLSQLSVNNSFIYGTPTAGGIVGQSYNNYMTLSRVSARGYVYGTGRAGGIVGFDSGYINIQDAYFAGATGDIFQPETHGLTFEPTGAVVSGGTAGGIIGISKELVNVNRVYLGNDALVQTLGEGSARASGLVGFVGGTNYGLYYSGNTYAYIENSFAAGTADASTGNVSGVVNYSDYNGADYYGIYSVYKNSPGSIENNWFINHDIRVNYAGTCAFNTHPSIQSGDNLEDVCEEETGGITGFYNDEHAVYDVGGNNGWEFVDGEPRLVDPAATPAWKALSGSSLPKLNFD